MRAVTWHGKRDVRVEEVPDPQIREPTDAIIEVTSTAICGSDRRGLLQHLCDGKHLISVASLHQKKREVVW